MIPDCAAEKPIKGKVIAVGKGKILENGDVRALDVKVGDNILFGKYSGTEVKVDGDETSSCAKKTSWPSSRSNRRTQTWLPKKYVSAMTPARACCAASTSWPMPSRHPRPQGPQCRAREELRRPDRHQGRRVRREGNRAEGQVREHGRADGEGSRFQHLRRSRRRHHHRHRAGPGDRPRRPEGRRRRRQPDGPQARHRQGRDRGRRRAEEALEAVQGPEGDRPGRHDLGEQRRVDRQDHRRRDGEGRQGRRDHG